MSELTGASLIAIALAAVWILVAVAVSVLAARRLASAGSVLDSARSMASLLEVAPARPLLVRPDGRIEADPRLLRELGIDQAPARLADLAGGHVGIEKEDLDALVADVEAAAIACERVERKVRAAGSRRVFDVRGGPAPPSEPPGTLLLWLFDTSASEEERSKLSLRLRQTEGALDSLTHLIESAPFPMWYRGPDLKLGLVNSAFVDAVEASDAAEVIANGIELIDEPGENGARAAALKALEVGKIQSRHQAAILRGERRMLRIVNVPLPTGAVAGFAIDIQELEDARFELARHVESQRELADRMTAGAAQFDGDRCLSFFNQPFAVMAQLDPDWLAERPEFDRVLERMRDNHRLPETRDFPAWKEERRGWFSSPEEVIEEEWMLANGDHLRVVAQPLPDSGLRLFLEDRTEQVRLASARDTLLRVRAATFDNLFEAISVFASDGRLYLWNRRFCQVWDLDEEWLSEHPRVDELVPAMARKLVNPTAAAQIREQVRQTTSKRESAGGRISMTDGRHFEFAAVPLPDGNALFTMVDVTDSTRIEAALRERATALEAADRVKTDFVANMSYELRTPLTSIGGFAEMLSEGYAGKLSPAAKDYVSAIVESSGRLAKLVDDVLDLTTGDTRGINLERERIDLAGLCRAAVETAQPRAAEKAQKLTSEIDASTGFVIGDARRLRESIEHVLHNAIAYTDRRGRIALRAEGDGERAVIEISDNGSGIAEEDLPRVFNRFDRVEEAGVRGEAALGLGLPLTRQFIEAHGGTVELVSKKSKGTTVTLTVPRGAP
ncbi:PAS domain-containing sensor histidine kinase [Sphingomonas sp.]|uniref:sensor histidine kinase n=1 Tax=Sphingomonas sp. TaxID=28214 RepID=UPI0017E10D36|nr:PAS domain-containing sensor histidine kinase [Sphingomonas sp.]MBA3511636.1 PAS-domain containing protein [Sphingomonas sp.]